MARSRQYPPSVDPGIPVEPPTPPGWKRVRFGDVLELIERPVQLQKNREYQLVNAKRSRGGIVARDRLHGNEVLVKNQFEIHPNDFLISKRQIIHGACGVVPAHLAGAIVSNEYAILQPKPPLTIEFLEYLSHTSYFQRTCFHSSVGVDVEKMVFKLEQWFQFRIPLPPEPEQRRIVAILSAVDDIIEKTQSVIDQLEVVKRSLLEELLTKGMPGQHKEFKETEIGPIPEEWTTARLGDVCERMFVGIAQAATQAYVDSGGVPIVRTTNLRPNHIDTSDLLHISNAFAEKMESKQLRAGDVLTARTGYPGTSAVVPATLHAAQCFTLLVSRPGPRILSSFLAHLMNSHVGERIVKKGQAGGAQQNLNIRVFSAATIPLPSPEEQKGIAEVMESHHQRVVSERAFLAGLRQTKFALLDALLSGRVRVPKVAEEAA